MRAVTLMIVVVSLLASAKARADEPDHAVFKQAVIDGNQAYAAKDYERARERYLYAYTIRPEPLLLYNAAQCFRQQGKLTEAADYFAQFLDTEPPDPLPRDEERARQTARELLDQIHAELSAVTTTEAPVENVDVVEEEPAPGPPQEEPVAPPGMVAAPIVEAPLPRRSSGDRLRTGAWITLGVAGLGVIVTGTFAKLAFDAESEKEMTPTQANADRVAAWEVRTNVAGGLTICAAVAGGALWAVSRSRGRSAPGMGVLVEPRGASVTAAWRW